MSTNIDIFDSYIECISTWLAQHRFITAAEYKKNNANRNIVLQLLKCNNAAEFYFQYVMMAAQLNLTYTDFAIMMIGSCAQYIVSKKHVFNPEMFVELADDNDGNKFEFVFKNPKVVIKLLRYAYNGPFVDKNALRKLCAHMLKRWPDLKKMNGFFAVSRKNNKRVRIPLMSDEEIDSYF